MAAGVAGPPGNPALVVKGEGPEAATTPPLDVGSPALDRMWS